MLTWPPPPLFIFAIRVITPEMFVYAAAMPIDIRWLHAAAFAFMLHTT